MATRSVTVLAFALALGVLASATPAGAADPVLQGRITDPDHLPLPGVTVTARLDGGRVLTAVTDQNGVYVFNAPVTGRVVLRAELAGFDVAEREVKVASGVPSTVDFTLRLGAHQEQVTVTAAPKPVIAEPHPDAPVTVTREVVENGMLPNNQYDDVLTLLPTVVRGPDGLISVGGARAEQGALVVNGFNLTDPVTGDPGLIIPTEAVESVDVYAGGYAAELGRATGGVTSVNTRAGADQFRSSLSSFFPRVNMVDGQVKGLKYWEPNIGASGPVLKDRLFYAQAISYRFDRNSFGTLAGNEDQKFNSFASWSQLDLQMTERQHLFAAVSFNPQSTDYYNITAFTPAGTVPRVDRHAFDLSIGDRVTLGGSATLEVRASYLRTSLSVMPSGTEPYIVGHEITGGSYFDRQDLAGDRAEGSAVGTWTGGRGHLLKAGVTLGRAAIAGTDEASPVTLLRSDGTISRSFEFAGGASLAASEYEAAAFVQDAWTVSRRVTIDAGLRYDRLGGVGQALSPRMSWTVKLPSGDSTLGGSVGLFSDKLPLDVLDFADQPTRLEQVYDITGMPAGAARLWTNQVGTVRVPLAARWDVQFDRHLGSSWQLRVKYQERHGRNEPVVEPIAISDAAGQLLLSSTGRSDARSVETTLGYRAPDGRGEVYLSYVRSSARGDLNSFALVNGLLREPFIQRNAIGPLPADVPNRLLAWGMARLPLGINVAPYLEVRDGFPYSAIDENWVRVGDPNGYRFPWFASLDLYVNRIFALPWHLPQARIGLKCWSLASVHGERDVQRDILRRDFGSLYNAVPRDYGGVFELLWGHK